MYNTHTIVMNQGHITKVAIVCHSAGTKRSVLSGRQRSYSLAGESKRYKPPQWDWGAFTLFIITIINTLIIIAIIAIITIITIITTISNTATITSVNTITPPNPMKFKLITVTRCLFVAEGGRGVWRVLSRDNIDREQRC